MKKLITFVISIASALGVTAQNNLDLNSDGKIGKMTAVVDMSYRQTGKEFKPGTYIGGILTGDVAADFFLCEVDTLINQGYVRQFNYYASTDATWAKAYGTGVDGVVAAFKANEGGKGIIKPIPQTDSVYTCGVDANCVLANRNLHWFKRAPRPNENGFYDHLTGKLLFSLLCGNPAIDLVPKKSSDKPGNGSNTIVVVHDTIFQPVYVHDTVKTTIGQNDKHHYSTVDTLENGKIVLTNTFTFGDIGCNNGNNNPGTAAATTTPAPTPAPAPDFNKTVYVLDGTQQATTTTTNPTQIVIVKGETVYADGGGTQYVKRGVDWYKVADIGLGLANLGLNIEQTVKLHQMGTYQGGGIVLPPNGSTVYNPTSGSQFSWGN